MDAPPHTMEQLEESLRRRFRTRESGVFVHGGAMRILQPANADELISEADFVRDERLPYWADIWPSSVAFAGAAHRLLPRGGRVLELGCGAGVVSSTAARLGYDVTATDYYADALAFARVNAWRNGGRDIAVRELDWRDFPSDLGTFDIVIACDVLYERPNAPLVAQAIHASLAPGGVALVADPGRVAVDDFLHTARALGLSVATSEKLPFVEGDIRQTITIFELRGADPSLRSG